jgi:hypothetical protein
MPINTSLELADWRVKALDSPADVSACAAEVRRELAVHEFQHDPEWLVAEAADPSRRLALVQYAGERAEGLLLARVSDAPFQYAIGGVNVLRKTLRQFTVHQGPALRQATPEAVEAGLCALARQLPANGVVYLSAVPVESCVHRALTTGGQVGRHFHVLAWGGENPHFKIRWAGTVAAYLASVSAKRRGNIKRAFQKLDAAGSLRFQRFQSSGEVDAFLRDARAIAAKSYQSEDSELGFSEDREALIRFAAAHGAFVGYVLYINDTPAAYRYGYFYGRTLFAISTAYDPAWSEFKPGSAIFLEMLQDLEKTKAPIDLIDLLPHDNSFKRDRANVVVATRNFYLFKRNLRGAALYYPVHALEAFKPAVKWAADWFNRSRNQSGGT